MSKNEVSYLPIYHIYYSAIDEWALSEPIFSNVGLCHLATDIYVDDG